MDYETRATNRNEIRLYAKLFRVIFGFKQFELIDPIQLLDKLPDIDIFKDTSYEVVEDNSLPENIPARCMPIGNGYIIEIKESVYMGAYERKVGGYRMHIMHEIMHVFADIMGFKPIYGRHCKDGELPRFKSLEWIVKALAGEVMIPYESSKNMTVEEIIEHFQVSAEAAEYRLKI